MCVRPHRRRPRSLRRFPSRRSGWRESLALDLMESFDLGRAARLHAPESGRFGPAITTGWRRVRTDRRRAQSVVRPTSSEGRGTGPPAFREKVRHGQLAFIQACCSPGPSAQDHTPQPVTPKTNLRIAMPHSVRESTTLAPRALVILVLAAVHPLCGNQSRAPSAWIEVSQTARRFCLGAFPSVRLRPDDPLPAGVRHAPAGE